MPTGLSTVQFWGIPVTGNRDLTPDAFLRAYTALWFRQVALVQDWYEAVLWETLVAASRSVPHRSADRVPPVLAVDRFLRNLR